MFSHASLNHLHTPEREKAENGEKIQIWFLQVGGWLRTNLSYQPYMFSATIQLTPDNLKLKKA